MSEAQDPDNHRETWRASEEKYLKNMYGFVPLSEIAAELGRNVDAVDRHRLEMQIPAVRHRNDVWTVGPFAEAVGLCRTAARNLARRSRFGITMYERDRPITAVIIDAFVAWLKDPLNWQHIDVDKIQDLHLRRVVAITRQKADDRWLTMKEAAEKAGYSRWGIYKMVREERLPAHKGSHGQTGNEKWLIRESDVQALIEANRVAL